MSEHKSAVAWQLWRLIVLFLRRKRFQQHLAEDVASDIVAGMWGNNSKFLEGGYPSELPRCLCQESLSKALRARKKSDRAKDQLNLDTIVCPVEMERDSPRGLSPLEEDQYKFLKRFFGDVNFEKLLATCGDRKPRQRDLADSIEVKRKRWKALRDVCRASVT